MYDETFLQVPEDLDEWIPKLRLRRSLSDEVTKLKPVRELIHTETIEESFNIVNQKIQEQLEETIKLIEGKLHKQYLQL